jgi:predicted ATPase
MIRLIEALHYRCLLDVHQRLGDFHVLVGPNAAGKTTFLDVIAFLGQVVSEDLEAAVHERTQNYQDLVWQRKKDHFELSVELEIPESRRNALKNKEFDLVRYELSVGQDGDELAILAEKVLLKKSPVTPKYAIKELFPEEVAARKTILTAKGMKYTQTIVNKVHGGNDNFYDETGKGWDHAFKLGPRKSALGNLPEDESKFPVATWLKDALINGVQRLNLNSLLMRRPSPPGQPRGFRPDGSNLPWVIDTLKKNHPEKFQDWVAHLKTALPDIENICTIERPEDRHRYLVVNYRDRLAVPSWMVSDGTLRLLALTLPSYLPELGGIFLIEEPENGIHPRAVESMFQSLSSVYGAQILMATHSPVILSVADASQVLCFSKTNVGATDIVNGKNHPALRNWKGEENLGVLFAGGVLG